MLVIMTSDWLCFALLCLASGRGRGVRTVFRTAEERGATVFFSADPTDNRGGLGWCNCCFVILTRKHFRFFDNRAPPGEGGGYKHPVSGAPHVVCVCCGRGGEWERLLVGEG